MAVAADSVPGLRVRKSKREESWRNQAGEGEPCTAGKDYEGGKQSEFSIGQVGCLCSAGHSKGPGTRGFNNRSTFSQHSGDCFQDLDPDIKFLLKVLSLWEWPPPYCVPAWPPPYK